MKRAAEDSGGDVQPSKKGPAVVVPDVVEAAPFEEMYQFFLDKTQRLETGVASLKAKLLKVQTSHSANAKFLGEPHLLNLANEILLLCKGLTKPNPTFLALTGARKTRFDALIKDLGVVDGKLWATKFDSINELRNSGIHCDTWPMLAARAVAARKFLTMHPYMRRSQADAVFIIENYLKFKKHSSA